MSAAAAGAADTPLAGERLAEEKAFATRYVSTLAGRPVNYAPDYAPPLAERPRKVPPVGVPVAPPPEIDEDGGVKDAAVKLTIKCLKPSLTVTVSAHLSDSVADLKEAVSAAASAAPPADAQRLLLKGKALADTKLLKEYGLEDGSVVHLMVKRSTSPVKAAEPAPATSPAAAAAGASAGLAAATSTPQASSHGNGHGRTLSNVSMSSVTSQPPLLTVTTDDGACSSDVSMYDVSETASPVSSRAFHDVAASPEFWQKIHALCEEEFAARKDADFVFDTFLVAMKGRLSANEAAKIRDVVGVAGMGGGV